MTFKIRSIVFPCNLNPYWHFMWKQWKWGTLGVYRSHTSIIRCMLVIDDRAMSSQKPHIYYNRTMGYPYHYTLISNIWWCAHPNDQHKCEYTMIVNIEHCWSTSHNYGWWSKIDDQRLMTVFRCWRSEHQYRCISLCVDVSTRSAQMSPRVTCVVSNKDHASMRYVF